MGAFDFLAGKSVLLIDDEPDLCVLIRAVLLRQQCAKVRIVHYPFEAYDTIREEVPDVILLDPNLCWFPRSYARRIRKFYPHIEVYASRVNKKSGQLDSLFP